MPSSRGAHSIATCNLDAYTADKGAAISFPQACCFISARRILASCQIPYAAIPHTYSLTRCCSLAQSVAIALTPALARGLGHPVHENSDATGQ